MITIGYCKYLFLLSFCCLFFSAPSIAQKKVRPKTPEVTFLHSPLGDFLYFLFNRKEYKAIPRMDSLIGMSNTSKLDALIALPEIVTSEQVTDYQDIYKILEKYYKNTNATIIEKPHPKRLSFSDVYPSYDSIVTLVKAGERYYPAFLALWKVHVEPNELKQIAVWKEQLANKKILDSFYKITRLSYSTNKLEIAAMAYHMAGSANYSPAGIYTSLFREPNLPWVIGHEGTHLLLSGPVSTNWMQTSKAKVLSILAERKGESLYEIEENTCHFLQAMLAKLCGTVKVDYSIHTPYPEGFRRSMLAYMEMYWSTYLLNDITIIDFMMQAAEVTLQKMPDKKP
jgi:hypothetical protein